MPTSGTYGYAPDIAELTDEAFERCGIDPATLTARHLRSARRSLNLLFSDWATRGIHLWAVDQQTQLLTQGDATYTVPVGTVGVLEMTVRRDGIDTPVWPMARDEYLAIPDKTTQGLPNRFWFERLGGASSIIHLWDVPENSTDSILYYRLRQLQDIVTAAENPDVPYFWNEALVAGLSAKLAEKYAPDREGNLIKKAEMRFKTANTEDRERTPTATRVKYSVGIRRR